MASRPTKYAHVLGGLPKFQSLEPERQDLVNAVKAVILSTVTEEESYNITAQILRGLADAEEVIKYVIGLGKKAIGDKRNAAAFARAYADVRAMDDAIDSWRSNVNMLLDAYEQLMIKQMEAEGVASLRLESGASVSTYGEPYGKVVDKEAFRRWCIANGYENQLQLWPSTMNALAKERTLQGEAPPNGVEVSMKTMIRLNKA